MNLPHTRVAIDEHGYPLFQEVRLPSEELAQELLLGITRSENRSFVSTLNQTPVLIESFDEPYVAHKVLFNPFRILLPYNIELEIDMNSLCVDLWDRFHGSTLSGIPFVLTDNAQADLFKNCDEFDDDSITIGGNRYIIPPLYNDNKEVDKESFWSNAYINQNTGWDAKKPNPLFVDILPRLKLPKSRVLLLGAGGGHDAAFFAEAGHSVTAIDFSPEAIKYAKQNYGHLENLKFIEADLFDLDYSFDESFDLIIEHTCFCAIRPTRRSELVKVWKRLLSEQGCLLGSFFAISSRNGPPYGATEWELRELLKKDFHFIFWGRSNLSWEKRMGSELLVYAQKK